jgi:hypothetical protein
MPEEAPKPNEPAQTPPVQPVFQPTKPLVQTPITQPNKGVRVPKYTEAPAFEIPDKEAE